MLMAMLVGLAACGASEVATPLPRATSDTIAAGTTVVEPTQASPSNAPPMERLNGACGEIVVQGTPPQILSERGAARASLNCFGDALAACSDAALLVREQDTNFVRQFSIARGNPCLFRQALQTSADAPPAVADCMTVRQDENGLYWQGCSHLGDYSVALGE